jgi:hypothetical protein
LLECRSGLLLVLRIAVLELVRALDCAFRHSIAQLPVARPYAAQVTFGERDLRLDRKGRGPMLIQLCTIANDVSRDVSAHTVEMDGISEELANEEQPAREKVLASIERIVPAPGDAGDQAAAGPSTLHEIGGGKPPHR